MGNRDKSDIFELGVECMLNQLVGSMICKSRVRTSNRVNVWTDTLPNEAVASSRIKSLLWRTRARASAIICLWPSEKFPPPLPTEESRVIRASGESSVWRLNSPAARSASFKLASSWSPNGSRFWRIVPDYGFSVKTRTQQRSVLYELTRSSGC